MPEAKRENRFIRSLYATPADWQRDLFYSAIRAGHLRAGREHRIERETYPGHEFILCLAGEGWAQIGGQSHQILANQLLWVNCRYPHAYGANLRDPWEVYWIRVEGRPLDRLATLMDIAQRPVIEDISTTAACLEFERIFQHMEAGRPSDAARVNAAVTALISIAFDSRLSKTDTIRPELPLPIQRAIEKMRLFYHTPIRVADLAALSDMSESHFSRMFKGCIGTSPIDWLRRERINQAKHRLIESQDPVKEIARQVGYSDQFFFSKDFKRMVKLTPSQFRNQEQQS